MRIPGIAIVILLAGCSDGEDQRAGARRHETPAAATGATMPEARVQTAPASAPVARQVPAAETAPASPGPAAPVAPTSSGSALEVVDATFTHGVERRSPIDRVTELRVGERVTYLVVVKNSGPATDIALEWVRGGHVIGRQTLAVGTSRAWRTWALRGVVDRDVASGIEVRVLDADGNVIHTNHARVTPTSVPTA